MEKLSSPTPTREAAVPRMRRVLTLWDLVFYGIILVQPIAPIPLFGVAQKLSNGHFVTTLLLAMLPMLITAFSYGRMAAIYPSAGSAYTYVGKGLNVYLGFLVGWAMLLDYLLVPLVNGIWVAVVIHARYLPQIPYVVAMLLVVVFMTAPNLRGIKTSALLDKILLVAMCSVTAVFIVLAIRFLFHYQGWGGLFSTQPFYNPRTFSTQTVWTATSYAALTYIGFDGVTTLAEDVKNPKRNVLLAIVLVCLFTGVFGGFLAYLGQRVWPDWRTLPNLETAFMDVCGRVGGHGLFHAMGFTILLAELGGGLAGIVGAARLLFGMGRDNVLPRKIFAHLSPGTSTPTYNILIVGADRFCRRHRPSACRQRLRACGRTAELWRLLRLHECESGRLLAIRLRPAPQEQSTDDCRFSLSLFGAVFCGIIWWNLDSVAKIVGGIWFLIGALYLAITTRGFRTPPRMIDFGDSAEPAPTQRGPEAERHER